MKCKPGSFILQFESDRRVLVKIAEVKSYKEEILQRGNPRKDTFSVSFSEH